MATILLGGRGGDGNCLPHPSLCSIRPWTCKRGKILDQVAESGLNFG